MQKAILLVFISYFYCSKLKWNTQYVNEYTKKLIYLMKDRHAKLFEWTLFYFVVIDKSFFYFHQQDVSWVIFSIWQDFKMFASFLKNLMILIWYPTFIVFFFDNIPQTPGLGDQFCLYWSVVVYDYSIILMPKNALLGYTFRNCCLYSNVVNQF